ncbi:MAG TPA: hypothetical protein VIL46_15145 [Gemmataceae bacterium]
MLERSTQASHVAARLLDFFGARTPWQRRLWNVGIVLGLKELIEASEAIRDNILSKAAFQSLRESLEVMAGQDP